MRMVLSFAAAILMTAGVSRADVTKVHTICRGANIPAHTVLLRSAVRKKLTDAAVAYKRVNVAFVRLKRSKGTLETDHSASLTLSNSSTPMVSFAGAFPTPDACNVTGKLRIMVFYEAGKTITLNDVTVPGTMLWKKRVVSSNTESLD